MDNWVTRRGECGYISEKMMKTRMEFEEMIRILRGLSNLEHLHTSCTRYFSALGMVLHGHGYIQPELENFICTQLETRPKGLRSRCIVSRMNKTACLSQPALCSCCILLNKIAFKFFRRCTLRQAIFHSRN